MSLPAVVALAYTACGVLFVASQSRRWWRETETAALKLRAMGLSTASFYLSTVSFYAVFTACMVVALVLDVVLWPRSAYLRMRRP